MGFERLLQFFSQPTSSSNLISFHITYQFSKMSSNKHEYLLDSLSGLVATKTAFPKSGHEMENYKLYPMEFSFAMRKAQDGRGVRRGGFAKERQ